MSTILRLKLLGIRSFGPDKNDEATVKFSSPLTLILGQNGCGKTTIIEALKYATCGELPGGTDQGSGFVHDPKLAHLSEVKGNIKLKVRDMKGNSVTVSRTVRALQKFKKLEFKLLDATYTRDNGESHSGKCVDIDSVMCQTLGVSPAVLTNVIFCHQEDSLWPLEKGKKVKEKFDAIFGITEYNRCLDYFRAMSKDLDQKKALLRKDVDYNNQIWTEAKEKHKKMDEFKTKAAVNLDSITEVENQIVPMMEEIKKIIDKEANFANHMSKITDKKNRKQIILETIAETKQEIREEFVGNKQDLLKEIEEFEKNLNATKDKLIDLESNKRDLQVEEIRMQKEIDAKTMVMGQLQRDEEQHKEKVELRNLQLKTLANILELTVVSSSQMNDINSEEILQLIKDKVELRNFELTEHQNEQKALERSMQSKIDQAREKKATLNQEIATKQKVIVNKESEERKVQAEIDEVEKSSEKLSILEKDLNTVNQGLDEAVGSFDVVQCKTGINSSSEEIKSLEERSIAVDEEVKLLLAMNVEKSNLDKLNERKVKLEQDLNSKKEKHRAKFEHLLFCVPESDFTQKIKDRIELLAEEIRSHKNSINENERKLCGLAEKKRSLEEQSRQKRRKMNQDENMLEECCGKQSIQEYYDSVTNKLAEANDHKGTITSSQFMIQKYIDKVLEDPKCPVCRREFTDSEEAKELLEDWERRKIEFPSILEEAESEVQKWSIRQKKAAGLLPLYEGLQNMKSVELPRLKSEVSNVEKQTKSIEAELEDRRNNLMGPQSDKEMASNILSDAILMDQYMNELHSLERDICKLESKLPFIAFARSLKQATDEQELLKCKLSNLRKQLNLDQRRLSEYNEKINKLRERKGDLINQQLKIVGGVQKLKTLQEKREDIIIMQSIMQDELNHARAQLKPVTDELEECIKNLAQIRGKHERLMEQKRKNIVELEKKIDEVKSSQSKIAAYNNERGNERLIQTREWLTQKRLHKKELEDRKTQLDAKIEECKQFQNTHELKKHDLDSNLKLRNKKKELSTVEDEIKELEGHLQIINFDQLRTEKENLMRKKKKLEDKKIFAEGRQQELNSRIRELERELNQAQYKNAEDEYRKHLVKLTITTKATDDLKLYEKAMDWAMIHFHKERMKMINTIVRSLWRSIYRGNDIDWVEIKTDESSSTASGRRSYNYRVVQVKHGVEMDMPGRCSAGQKVLACLIIRMALAETFSKNCGVLALDEPTTNLDQNNIAALSEALREIVDQRSAQRNFQLIVITHDEEFMRKLSDVNKVDRYIEVKRDDRGRSRILNKEVY